MPPKDNDNPRKRGKRKRQERIELVLSESEKQTIVQNAEQCGLSISTYLRNLGLGIMPRSLLDADVIQAIVRTHADLSRLRGVVQMGITLSADKPLSKKDMRSMVRQIDSLQEVLQGLVQRL